MSEYQYYEFQAVDRPLERREQEALRAISTRARITASGFTNHYEWGDLKADPGKLLERYFDLFLYLANWGSRRFAMRLPRGTVTPEDLEPFALDDDVAELRLAGPHLIVDIAFDELDLDGWDDGEGWLAALAPLRADLLDGDLRLFYLAWLMAVEAGNIHDDAPEPLPGIAPLTAPLQAFAEFFAIDPDLLDVAARGEARTAAGPSHAAAEAFVRALPEEEKAALLLRLHHRDPRAGNDLRRRCRRAVSSPASKGPRRTAGELRAAATRQADERHRLAEEKAAAERRRHEQERARARAGYLAHLAARGDEVWREVEVQISLRNAFGYERAVTLLADLCEIARMKGRADDFTARLAVIRARHERKRTFVERLDAAGLGRGAP